LLGRIVTVHGMPIDLTGREFDLLELFLRNPRRVLTRSFISETIWEMPFDPETNLLDFFMSKLRSKLEPGMGRPVFKTIRGVGYELE
jgi:DNA-binding response OmpR family regulator